MTKLYLHIGAAKTGSSYLQSTLHNNRQALMDQGIYYPYVPSSASNARLLFRYLCPHRNSQPPAKEVRAWLNEVISKTGITLLSDEKLCTAEPKILTEFRQWFDGDVTIIYFVRDLLDHAYSVWGQELKKAAMVQDWPTFAADYTSAMWRRIERFIEVFGAENCQLKNYSTCRTTLIPEILRAIGLEDTSMFVETNDIVNRSLNHDEIACMLAGNRRLESQNAKLGRRVEFSTWLSDQLLASNQEIPFPLMLGLNQETVTAFDKRNRSAIDQINRLLPMADHVEVTREDLLDIGPPKITSLEGQLLDIVLAQYRRSTRPAKKTA